MSNERPQELRLSDEMIDRAADVLTEFTEPGAAMGADHGMAAQDVARKMLEAAFEDVPLTNFGIGLLLQAVDRVIITRESGMDGVGAMVFVANGDPDGFDAAAHTLNTQLKAGGPRGMYVRTLSFTFDPPEEARDAV